MHYMNQTLNALCIDSSSIIPWFFLHVSTHTMKFCQCLEKINKRLCSPLNTILYTSQLDCLEKIEALTLCVNLEFWQSLAKYVSKLKKITSCRSQHQKVIYWTDIKFKMALYGYWDPLKLEFHTLKTDVHHCDYTMFMMGSQFYAFLSWLSGWSELSEGSKAFYGHILIIVTLFSTFQWHLEIITMQIAYIAISEYPYPHAQDLPISSI